MIEVQVEQGVKDFQPGIVVVRGLCVGPSNVELRGACAEVVSRVLKDGMAGGEARREAVRRMLRAGGYKPAGRNKPAQEYLLRTATESGELPTIFNAVDWLNAVSLHSGLPISLLSAARLGPHPSIRYGRGGEKFVFNRAGQELDLECLICVCAGHGPDSIPLGTPIKDSMDGKIGDADRDVVAILYAPQSVVSGDELTSWCEQLRQGFIRYCHVAESIVCGPTSPNSGTPFS